MKSHIYRLLFLAFLTSTLIILSCEKDDITASTTEEKYQIDLFGPDSDYVENTTINQIEILNKEDNIKVSTFGQFDNAGYPKNLKKLLIEDINNLQDVVFMYDEQHLPAFAYGVNRLTNKKYEELFEFEMEGGSCFSLRIYEMDWNTGIANWKRSTLICKGENEFHSNVVVAFEENEDILGRHQRFENIRDYNETTITNSGTKEESYLQLASAYNHQSLIKEGLEWMGTLDNVGLDNVVNPRCATGCKELAGLVIGGITLAALYFANSEFHKKANDEIPVLKKLNDLLSNSNFNVFSSNSAAASDYINYYPIFANLWNGEWQGRWMDFKCQGSGFTPDQEPPHTFTTNITVNSNGELTKTTPEWFWFNDNNNTISQSGLPNIPNWSSDGWTRRVFPSAPTKKADGTWEWKFTRYSTNNSDPKGCIYQAHSKYEYILTKQ